MSKPWAISTNIPDQTTNNGTIIHMKNPYTLQGFFVRFD